VLYSAIVGTLKMKMFIMLTYWSLYTLTACQVLRAVNVWKYIALKKQNKGKYSMHLVLLKFCICWFFYENKNLAIH